MTCDKNSPLLSRWMDGELPASAAEDLRGHVDRCVPCRAKVDAWRAQSASIRSFFREHALQESFVDKVRRANESRQVPELSTSEKGWLGKDMFTWLQAAAAVLIVVFLGTQLFRPVQGLALAKVIDPGVRLEVHPAKGTGWNLAVEGATLRHGDWLRNQDATSARVLLNDSSRITLQDGTLARLDATGESPAARIALVRGAIFSEVADGSPGVEVRSGTGRIVARDADFDLRLHDVTATEFRAISETGRSIRGSVQAVAGVTVWRGSLEAEDARSRATLGPGGTRYLFAGRTDVPDMFPGAVRDAGQLRLHQSGTSGDSGVMVSSVEISEKGLMIRLSLESAPLSRVLEWVFKARVAGADTIRISGDWSYPSAMDLTEVASDLERELKGKLVFRHEPARRKVAHFAEREPVETPAESERRFEVDLSGAGLVSFRFREVPAGVAFQSLRLQGIEVPVPGKGEEWTPVTISAEGIRPEDVSSRLERDLMLRITEQEISETWIEWRPLTTSTDSASSFEPLQDLPHREGMGLAAAASSPVTPRSAVSWASERKRSLSTDSPHWRIERPDRARDWAGDAQVWNVLMGSFQGTRAGQGTSGSASTLTKSTTLTASSDGGTKLDAIRREFRGPLSRHLVWPVRSAEHNATEYYRIYNPGGISASAIWYGYDVSGLLVWRRDIEIPGESEAVIVPRHDFGANEAAGGHWETRSNVPLKALFMRRQDSVNTPHSVAAAETAGSVTQFEEVRLSGVGGESRPWVVNHGEEAARVRVSVLSGYETILSREIVLAPHASWRWSAAEHLSGGDWDLGRSSARFRIVLETMSGAVSAGILPR